MSSPSISSALASDPHSTRYEPVAPASVHWVPQEELLATGLPEDSGHSSRLKHLAWALAPVMAQEAAQVIIITATLTKLSAYTLPSPVSAQHL